MKIRLLLFMIGFFLTASFSFVDASPLNEFAKLHTSLELKKELTQIVRQSIEKAYDRPSSLIKADRFFDRSWAIFITAKHGQETRGCMGSLFPKSAKLTQEIALQLKKAFFEDLRHRPIRWEEVPTLEIYVTAVGQPIPIRQIESISLFKEGVLIKSGDKEAISLPGEAKTHRYLLSFLKAKAGIQPRDKFQLFRIPTVVIKAYPE